MIPVGTSVNPGELRSGPKWKKTFISCLGVPDTSPGTHLVYIHPNLEFPFDIQVMKNICRLSWILTYITESVGDLSRRRITPEHVTHMTFRDAVTCYVREVPTNIQFHALKNYNLTL